MRELVLYSRQGCCLCEGLESRLGDLELSKLELVLQVIDIDAPENQCGSKSPYSQTG